MLDGIFFLSSKIAWIILSPSNFILTLFVVGSIFVIFNHRYISLFFFIPATLLSVSIMAYPIGDLLIEPLEKRFAAPQEMPKKVDGILVLGGGEELGISLSWKKAEIGNAGDRYLAAKKLADIYSSTPIIFTGGSGTLNIQNGYSEAHIARTLLTDLGIHYSRLIIEGSSRNTYENFKMIKPHLPKETGNYMLITSAFHMPRAVGVARKAGVNVIPYPVDYRSHTEDYRFFDFKLYQHLHALEASWREWIGLTAYYFTEKTDTWFPKPE